MIPDLNIGGIALAPVIVALIELAKKFGLPSKYAIYVNAAFSVGAYFATFYLTSHAEVLPWGIAVIKAFIIFLTTAGLYDVSQNASVFKKKTL